MPDPQKIVATPLSSQSTQTLTPETSAPAVEHQSPSTEPHDHDSTQSVRSRGRTSVQGEDLARAITSSSRRSKRRQPRWWKVRLFRGMINDVKRRAPYYLSDWTDAWDYRVVPATIYMYFANILPALAFSLDMFVKTDNSYGVNEVLLASVLGCVVFSLFSAQPLVIVGVTGPITVFSYTVYDIVVPSGTDFFSFMAWVGIWALIMHWILAITNSCNSLTYVTRFSCDIFGFYVAFIYLQKGIQVLTRTWEQGTAATPYLQITVALLVMVFAYGCGIIGESRLLPRQVRKFVEDYGTPLTIIFFTGFVHIGRMKEVPLEVLPVSKAFFPTTDRSWFVNPGNLSVGEVFLALPFGLLLTILFWFDHNGKHCPQIRELCAVLICVTVSSLIAQGTEFPLRKPPGFHWDIFLLGVSTFVAGILGIPFPNGLIPQAPFHTASLCVEKRTRNEKGETLREVDHVVEQRVSNLAQGLLFVVTMTGPLLIVLNLIPQGVLAGLFFVMGLQALAGNGITLKLLYLFRDPELHDHDDPLRKLDRQLAIWVFVMIELVGFGATFAITQTIAAIGFPVIILLLIPFRTWAMPYWFKASELRALDAPTAGSFVMSSVGGSHGYEDDSEDATPVSEQNTTQSTVEKDGESTRGIEDNMERGESNELRKRNERNSDDRQL